MHLLQTDILRTLLGLYIDVWRKGYIRLYTNFSILHCLYLFYVIVTGSLAQMRDHKLDDITVFTNLEELVLKKFIAAKNKTAIALVRVEICIRTDFIVFYFSTGE